MKSLRKAAEELVRQHEFVAADRVPRVLGACSGFLLAMGFVPIARVAVAMSVYAASEFLAPILMRRLVSGLDFRAYVLVLGNAFMGACAFAAPPLMLWQRPEEMLHIAAVVYLTGALLNAAMVRSTHVPHGFSASIPPAAALLYVTFPGVGAQVEEWFSFATVMVLLSYFGVSLLMNHRMQSELALARDTAELANSAKARFLSTISHDMRTPLNAIQGMGQLLKTDNAPGTVQERAQTIEAAALMLRTIVDDVLDFTASRDQALTINPVTSSLPDEVAVVVTQHAPAAIVAGQTFTTDLSALPALAVFDATRLRQCLRGLLVASGAAFGPGRIDVVASQRPLPGGRVAVMFDVSGPVLPGRMADPGDPQIELAATLARAMDGALNLRSRLNPTLSLRLTLGSAAMRQPDPPATAGRRILVVDDIATNRLVVSQMLRHMGFQAEEASGGRAALLALADNSYDLVLLDLNMPDMNGEETLRAIRKAGQQWSGIPVVGLTANAEAARQRDIFAANGMDSLMTKPVDADALASEIMQVIAVARNGRQGAGT